MERGWWFGVIAGLLVVFVIFMAGFYSGNVVTGQFFHKLLFGEQIAQSLSQESDDLAVDEFEAGETEDLDTDEDSDLGGGAYATPQNYYAITPVKLGPGVVRNFGVFEGSPVTIGCNVLTPRTFNEGTSERIDGEETFVDEVLNGDEDADDEDAGGETRSGVDWCRVYGYDICSSVNVYLGADVVIADCSTNLTCGGRDRDDCYTNEGFNATITCCDIR